MTQNNYSFLWGYFLNKKSRKSAWLYLAGTVLTIIALTFLYAAFAAWNAGFMAAIIAKSTTALISSLQLFAQLMLAIIAVDAIQSYIKYTLINNWREWLTAKLIKKYLKNGMYLDISRLQDQLPDPEQRIQSDVKLFVTNTVKLVSDSINSFLTLIVFAGTLWIIGGSLSFTAFGIAITIPGYLFWAAVVTSSFSNIISYYLAKDLPQLESNQLTLEAKFREQMISIKTNSENIAIEHGEKFYKRSLVKKLAKLINNAKKIVSTRIKVTIAKDILEAIPRVLPYLSSAPLYFAEKIGIEQLTQISINFSQVNYALSWFVNSQKNFSSCKASFERLVALDKALSGNLKANDKKIEITINPSDTNQIACNIKNIKHPEHDSDINSNLQLTLKQGDHTLIKGGSGKGKSTLFKVIAGTWQYGEGDIFIPTEKSIYFLPQKPILPYGTLKKVLAYPETTDTYTDEQYRHVLSLVGNMEKFTDQLDDKKNWASVLSPGQQQRISFARALLKKPDWLFLDETTASLDPASEEHLYQLIQRELPNTTRISIAHRESVTKFHNRVVTVDSGVITSTTVSKSEALVSQVLSPVRQLRAKPTDAKQDSYQTVKTAHMAPW